MSARGPLALVRATWLSWMQYRGFFFLLAFMWMIPPLVYLLVWSAAAGDGAVRGFSRGELVAYYLVLIPVNQLTYAQTNWTVGDAIRQGRMNALLLRPMPPVFDAVAAEVAGKVVFMAFVAPVTAVLAAAFRPQALVSVPAALEFVPALILAWALRFSWGYWLALLAFRITRADSLLSLQDALVFLLAGQAAPIALLPAWLEPVATVLPFRSMLGFPVEVLLGRLDGSALVRGFLIQAGWLAVASVLAVRVWRAGVRRYTAVGG